MKSWTKKRWLKEIAIILVLILVTAVITWTVWNAILHNF